MTQKRIDRKFLKDFLIYKKYKDAHPQEDMSMLDGLFKLPKIDYLITICFYDSFFLEEKQ